MTRLDPPRVLVLGYGNPGRQDDGLGAAVVAGIAALGWSNVTAFENYQLNIEDSIDVAENDIVWFVDATRTGVSPYDVQVVSSAPSIEFTTHIMKPAAIMAIARQVHGVAPEAFLLAVRGYGFEFAEGLTPGGSENLRAALAMLIERIQAVQARAPT